jgi:DNA-binding NarL/FixJ family response regulator
MKQALVVDDHPLICEAVGGLLQKAFPGLDVHVSSGGDGVLVDVCRRAWDVVILDINMPGRNGSTSSNKRENVARILQSSSLVCFREVSMRVVLWVPVPSRISQKIVPLST